MIKLHLSSLTRTFGVTGSARRAPPSLPSSTFASLAIIFVGVTLSVTSLADARKSSVNAAGLTDDDATTLILKRMADDLGHFERVLDAERQGRTVGGLEKVAFAAEVKRARGALPLLKKFDDERIAYSKGKNLSYPSRSESHVVYTNLIALLNMMQEKKGGDADRVLVHGARVVVSDRDDVGRARGGSDDLVRLFRLYFFLMGEASYRAGDDAKALVWFARLDADQNLKALKARLEKTAVVVDGRTKRLDELRALPLAVVPFEDIGNDDASAWVGSALLELLSSDLAATTDFVVVDRGRIHAARDDVTRAIAGFTDGKPLGEVRALVGASSVLIGSYQQTPRGVHLWLKLVDVETGRVLGASDVDTAETSLIKDARALTVTLLEQVGWGDAVVVDQLRLRPEGRPETLRALHDARAHLVTNPVDAKAHFLKAVRKDPGVANLFQDVRAVFKDVAATVAVLPFTSISGAAEDAWRTSGVRDAMATDLPQLGFHVVDRAAVDDVLALKSADARSDKDVGQRLSADFVVTGSVLRQAPLVRVDVRFIDVDTGAIMYATSVEDPTDNLPTLLRRLSVDVATHFHHPLDDKSRDALIGARMDPDAFERFARTALAEDERRAAAGPTSARGDSVDDDGILSDVAFWSGVSAVVGGGLIGGAGLAAAQPFVARAWQLHGVQQAVVDADAQATVRAERDQNALLANVASGIGIAGLMVAGVGVTTVVVESLFFDPDEDDGARPPSLSVNQKSAPSVPTLAGGQR